ncbi:hypothetical protein HNP86_001917 [Methanococcus maripaludis]|uniref:Uncharacterized protein n=1 Tax=Methanococcus maripaludis TaxID=39152 RepID=A0A7J9NVQ0_METMI|nr:hypothetical protein [Methanococcus maripaludis]MBA2851758.1 hypothetical protein [Methanococcus maripaludis]
MVIKLSSASKNQIKKQISTKSTKPIKDEPFSVNAFVDNWWYAQKMYIPDDIAAKIKHNPLQGL